MSISETISSFASGVVDWNRRPVALNFGKAQGALGHLLALQHAHVHEGLMTGIHGHLTCVSPRHNLSPRLFLGVPVSIRLVTDRGQLHFVNAIVQDVQIGQSDGELCVYQLTVCDALSLMDKRTNSRVFRQSSVVDILATLFNEWRQRSPALAAAFEFDLSGLSRDRYPARELTRQVNESDAKFVRRLLRREGITVFANAGSAKGARDNHDDTPVHTLVCCDEPMSLPEAPAGTVRLHPRDAATEERDTVTLFALHQRLTPGQVGRPSWDYKKARIDESMVATSLNQGEAGNDLAQLLTDVAIDIPHMGDSWNDHERLTRARMLAHQFEAERYDGVSSVRDLAVGAWITLTGDPEWDMQTTDKRQFVITSIDHDVWNNLPKGLTDRVQALFAASRHLAYPSPSRQPAAAAEPDTRYENRFTCVRRGVPLTPAYDPKIDLPPVHLLTGTIVGQQGEEVFCDADGRVRVRIHGLDPVDHAHAQGAGTNDNAGDSAPIRVGASLAGGSFGSLFLPRVGMEVLIGSLGGDPDRLIIINVLSNGVNPPAAFTHIGNLPGNRYVSGIKTKEIKGRRYNQLRLDDTPGQISSQLASEHAHSQLNLGYLTQPRQDGRGQDRGEGAELRTDAAAALRAAQGILLTTYARSQASGGQLDRDELLRLLGECTELFKSLGDYAGQHGGQASDTAGQQAVAAAFKGWTPGSGSGASGTGTGDAAGSQALMAFGAQAGSVAMTPKTHVTYAGENIDQVAQQHVQLTSGQRITLHGGRGVAMFAHSDGVSAIANQGKVTLQSQNDDTQIDSAKNIQFTAAGGKLAGMASDEVVFTTSGGAYLKLHGSDIELGCPGTFTVKSAGHSWQGPASMSTDMPKFDHAPLGRVPKLVRPTDGQAVEGMQAEITKASGEVVKGQSDAAGKLAPIQSNQFEPFVVNFFKNKT
ncbi:MULTISPECIES: type VI secretion system Vgr family protein [Burkholderia]|uniref:type VI secretion system Vgr family protein n=1 Tax=Burkholderia TaxID=32008 RepID=UPI00068ED063|nr:type VI secretion system Vgr family protein [Burkholderia pyrrocinia]EKS9885587.1 type VI secretion system tip protein VgrG [Burkholderia pyrrocinia]EKS9896075.1 type VI secretion system tip protein VgrG [Burkholderia pyrrocinia]EKS9907209.1 type VI secretion system tip protein VgrG [Burkholderia pyrrocinia]TDA43697.1 type VI secretion system tip protein VgrG [Burkholderia pyrrocinia]